MSKHTGKKRMDNELEKLRRELKAGRKRVSESQEKANIEIEKSQIRKKLLLLRHPKKVALAQRFGRGFKVTGKKVGQTLIKQGKLIAAQQERDRRLEVARVKILSKPVKVRKSKKTKSSSQMGVGGFDLTRLDF